MLVQMSFVRTILGDVGAGDLGVCYAHEHVIIDPSFATAVEPQFLLDDVDRAVAELSAFRAHGGRAMVDAMPIGCGRNPAKLAEVSRRSGVHVVCPTGVHLAKYYPPGDPFLEMPSDALAEWFVAEIGVGIGGNPSYRAGVIKVAGGRDRLSDAERRAFIAAAAAHRRTGCPILTHTEQGTAAMEQVALLREHGAEPSRVTLSHTDRLPDPAYHRQLLRTGVNLEYDSCFRWKPGQGNPTLDLLVALLPAFPDQLMLGMDAARRTYWASYGGSPGLGFLLTEFSPRMRAAGIDEDLIRRAFVNNPARAYSFAEGRTTT
jgi:phosphotriesterase-related protein